jgi:hypothetical protein
MALCLPLLQLNFNSSEDEQRKAIVSLHNLAAVGDLPYLPHWPHVAFCTAYGRLTDPHRWCQTLQGSTPRKERMAAAGCIMPLVTMLDDRCAAAVQSKAANCLKNIASGKAKPPASRCGSSLAKAAHALLSFSAGDSHTAGFCSPGDPPFGRLLAAS